MQTNRVPQDGATFDYVIVGGGSKAWNAIASSADGTKLAAVVYGGNIWRSTDS